jgi:hypothetical protein
MSRELEGAGRLMHRYRDNISALVRNHNAEDYEQTLRDLMIVRNRAAVSEAASMVSADPTEIHARDPLRAAIAAINAAHNEWSSFIRTDGDDRRQDWQNSHARLSESICDTTVALSQQTDALMRIQEVKARRETAIESAPQREEISRSSVDTIRPVHSERHR